MFSSQYPSSSTSVLITFHIRLSELSSSELSCGSGKGGNSSDLGLPIKSFVIINVIYQLVTWSVTKIIRWRSISMRAGPALLQFDGSKAGLSMDLSVFVYSHTKTSFKFLSRQGRYRAAVYVVTDLLLQTTQREPYRALVLSGLESVKIY